MAAPNNPELARKLFEGLDQIHIVAIHPNGLQITGKDFEDNIDNALAYCSAQSNAGLGVYWTVNNVRSGVNQKPKKSDIVNCRFLHCDIDPPKTGGAFDKAKVTAFLMDSECPPSFIVDSGNGLGAFWRLDGPHLNMDAVEYVNQQISDFYQADHCWNIDRVMRIPGFRNIPNKAKKDVGRTEVATGWMVEDTGEVYESSDVSDLFPEAKVVSGNVGRLDVELEGIESLTVADIGLNEQDAAYQAIMTPDGTDRSADGLGAVRLMAMAGKTDEQIAGILINGENPVAAHFLEQKYLSRAIRRVIGLVRVDNPEVPQLDIDFSQLIDNVQKRMKPDALPFLPTGFAEQAAASDAAPKYTVPEGVPAWRRDIGCGALAQFIDHCDATGTSPQPYVSLGAGLACFGALAGRRYKSPSNLRTNLYSIGICDSGGGKDNPLRQATELMIAAEQVNQAGPAKLASGQGLLTAVKASPSIMLPLDEIGFLMRAASGKNAQKYIVEILDNLTQLYSMAPHTFMGVQYADNNEKPRDIIVEPCVTLVGVTTPKVFWENLSSGNVQDGSLARMVIFESENHYPDANHDANGKKDFPAHLVNMAKMVAAGVNDPFPMGISPSAKPNTYTVEYADEMAKKFAREMRDEQTDMLRQHAGSHLTSVIARLAENAVKIALVHAISENPSNPRIRVSNLDWGLMIARKSVDSLTVAIRDTVADNEQEEFSKRILKIIRDAGKGGITKNAITRKTQKIEGRRRSSILADLVEAEEVTALHSVGSKTIVYYA